MFSPEGYEQNRNPSKNGSDKGGGEGKKDKDPLIDDDLSDTGHGGEGGSKGKDQNNSQGQLSTNDQGSKNAPAGSKNVRRLLHFDLDDLGDQTQTMECAKLLGAMELDEEEDVEEEIDLTLDSMIQDDDETSQLPEEWVFDLTY